jgi:hypothetical protein
MSPSPQAKRSDIKPVLLHVIAGLDPAIQPVLDAVPVVLDYPVEPGNEDGIKLFSAA